jgi:hypothetical protein
VDPGNIHELEPGEVELQVSVIPDRWFEPLDQLTGGGQVELAQKSERPLVRVLLNAEYHPRRPHPRSDIRTIALEYAGVGAQPYRLPVGAFDVRCVEACSRNIH